MTNRGTRALAAATALLLAACTGAGGDGRASGTPAPSAAGSALTGSGAAPTPGTSSTDAPSRSAEPSPTRTSSATSTPPGSKPATGGTVVAAAGDIACDPANASYKNGAGTPNACRQMDTSDLVIAMKPKAALVLGDLQYEVGRIAAFRASYDKSWGRFKDITLPAPGNHEYGTGVTRGYFEYFGPRAGTKRRSYYSTDVGGWHVISLNSNCAQIDGCQRGSPQEKWLRADLAANKKACTLAIFHHPRWTSGLHGESTKVDGLWRTLAEGGVDIALAAHDHHYERFAPLDADGEVNEANGVRSFVVGTGGRNLYPVLGAAKGSEVRDFQTFGVLKLTLQPKSYDWEFVGVPGSTFTDSGSGSCH